MIRKYRLRNKVIVFKPKRKYIKIAKEYLESKKATSKIKYFETLLNNLPKDVPVDKQPTNFLERKDNVKPLSVEDLLEDRKKIAIQEEKKRKKEWSSSNTKFSTKKYMELWKNESRITKNFMLPLAIKAFSIYDGIEKASDVIRFGLEMPEAAIDGKFASKLLNKILSIEFAEKVVSRTSLPNYNKNEILYRIIAQEFPLRDAITGTREPDYMRDMKKTLNQLAEHQEKQDYYGRKSKVDGSRLIQGIRKKNSEQRAEKGSQKTSITP